MSLQPREIPHFDFVFFCFFCRLKRVQMRVRISEAENARGAPGVRDDVQAVLYYTVCKFKDVFSGVSIRAQYNRISFGAIPTLFLELAGLAVIDCGSNLPEAIHKVALCTNTRENLATRHTRC